MTPLAASALGIILVVVLVVVLVLAAGGWAAATRRARAGERTLVKELATAERELATAHASDKGWDRALLDAAARAVVAERFGGDAADGELQLVRVIDRPGTDADQAVFRLRTADGQEHRVTLGRSGGTWGPA